VNWEAIGAIGEVIGALAVFCTLVYLASQIKQNTRAVQSSALDSTINIINTVRQSIYENDDVAQVYIKGLSSPDELSDLERVKFRLLLHNQLLSQSHIFAQTKFSNLLTSEWSAQKAILKRVLNSPGGQWFWENFECEFDQDFGTEINKIMT
jgi:hypothetical protein